MGGECKSKGKDCLRVTVYGVKELQSQAERESRLQRDRERHGTLPFLDQLAVKSKIQKFHQHCSTL